MILAILCFIAGAALIATGIYFLTPSFLNKMKLQHAKACAYVALGLGALTLVWGFMLLSFPQIASPLVLVYMIFVLAAVSVLLVMYK